MLPAQGQNCDVDFPGTANRLFSATCGGPTVANLELGKNIHLGNGDSFTFDLPVINITGNLHVDVQGSGRIIIPAGVTVNVGGNVQLHSKNSECTSSDPCVFEIVVNGTANFTDDLDNDVYTVIWSGTGNVIVDDDFKNSSNGCMDCGVGGCPNIQVSPSDCTDDGSGCGGDFCSQINNCSSDVIDPIILNCPSNQVVNMTGPGCTRTVSWTPPTASDNCALFTFTSSHTPGSIFPKGVTVVTYTATDVAGNIATCSFNVTVVDNILPVITCLANINASADASCQAVVNWTAPTFTDNCAGGTLTSNRAPGSTFVKGTTVVTYTATDAAGNIATCSFNVNVLDNSKPVITGCPGNITTTANASCQAVVTWAPPTFTDNCTGGTLTSNKVSGSTFAKGITVVTYTATDAVGNTETCSFNVNVVDNLSPVITSCPANKTASANASCQAIVTWTPPSFTDNCPGTILTTNKAPGSSFPVGTTVVTYTATDLAGNISTCSFNVTVSETTPPVIIGCPGNIILNANASCQAVGSWVAPSFTDNCAGGVLTTTKTPGSTFAVGTTVVTYTATDAAGNIATCSFNVNVVDNTPPVIVGCPSNIVASANASCQAVVTWTAPTLTDNCSGGTLTSTKSPGSTFTKGLTVVTYSATDAAGRTSTCSFNVSVVDTSPPVITGCPGNITANANASCQAVVNWPAPSFVDNCAGGTLTTNKNPGSTFSTGVTVVTYTATDAAGNTATCSFNVVVTNIPTFTSVPANIVMEATKSGNTPVNWNVPTAEASCEQFQLTSTHSPGDAFAVGQHVVEYTATTESGAFATCSFSITITLPEIIPNEVITPDGNNENDVWLIENIEKFPDNHVIVFDRWGGVVFRVNAYNNENISWNGHNAPVGTYYYTLIINAWGSKIEKKGFIELVK